MTNQDPIRSARVQSPEQLLEDIMMDTYDDDEQLWAFRQAFEDNVVVPLAAHVIGEPVEILEFDYDGNPRRGLTARCRDRGGEEHAIAVSDLLVDDPTAAVHVAAYRKWMGLGPPLARRRSKHLRAAPEDIALDLPLDLIFLSVKKTTARCQIPGSGDSLTLRTRGVWEMVPGEITTVTARKRWRHAGHPYMSGDIERSRLDVPALGLTPLHAKSS